MSTSLVPLNSTLQGWLQQFLRVSFQSHGQHLQRLFTVTGFFIVFWGVSKPEQSTADDDDDVNVNDDDGDDNDDDAVSDSAADAARAMLPPPASQR